MSATTLVQVILPSLTVGEKETTESRREKAGKGLFCEVQGGSNILGGSPLRLCTYRFHLCRGNNLAIRSEAEGFMKRIRQIRPYVERDKSLPGAIFIFMSRSVLMISSEVKRSVNFFI